MANYNILRDIWRRFAGYHPPYLRGIDDLDHETRYFVSNIMVYPLSAYPIATDILKNETIHPHFKYRHFTKAKKDGSKRDIFEPDPRLKLIQRNILEKYLNQIEPHKSCIGFRKKHSIADHVWAHSGANVIITADIEDFFPNTSEWRVEQWWKQQLDSEQASQVATLLTTCNGTLPQGAVTSPALSNLVNVDMDTAIERRLQESGATYTRYGDDLVFSWIFEPPADFQVAITGILREHGYRLNSRKGWQLYSRQDEPQITGVVLTKNGEVRIPDKMKKIMKKLSKSESLQAQSRLQGYSSYQAMIEKQPHH